MLWNAQRTNAETDRKALADIERQLKAIIATIEEGGYTRMLSDRLRALEAQQDEIAERLARAPINIPDIHPECRRHLPPQSRAASSLSDLADYSRRGVF